MDKIKFFLCGVGTPMGAIADFIVGSAAECYCCTFYRACAVVGLPLFIIGIIIGKLI